MVYIPSHFAEPRPEVLVEFIRDHNFGVLVSTGETGLIASHIPLNTPCFFNASAA